MKLNPQQAPLYGQCVITVQLSDEELAADEEGVDYFLLFAGSTQRHLTSTLRSSHDTLQALCPAHDCCEAVLVTLCAVCRGVSEDPEDLQPCLGRLAPLAEHRFTFVQDLAFDMAQFLVSTAGRADGLDGALLLDECQIPLLECERLDESLALALHHLVLPAGWSLLGNKPANNTDLDPQETLLHFSARRGLFRVTHFLLRQPGAREALRLANRQGHTPAAIAEQRGHTRLHEFITQVETDTETDIGTGTVQSASTDARAVCNLPTLNTHTLTLSIKPGRDPPTLQRSVEQLLHLICHLHAKGVSELELQFDSLHTAAECCDGVETEITCLDRLQPTATASECLDTTTQGSWQENCSVESSCSVDYGRDETGNAEKDRSLSVSTPTSEVRPQEHGLGPPEDWVCLNSNTEKDYCQAEEEGSKQPLVSTHILSLSDSSEEAQSEAKGGSLTVGTLPPGDCGKQTEETDRGEAVIREGQEATESEDRSEQETEDGTARRREEETESESTDLITPSGDTIVSDMGQSPSSEAAGVSDSCDSEVKECCQDGEIAEKEMKHDQEVCAALTLEERVESEGLTDPLSTPGDPPNPSLIDHDDVIEESESAVPCLLIEGLHEGEPPPDTNSLEQNQETAGRDYAIEQQRGSAPETGNCTEGTIGKELDGEKTAEPSGYNVESFSMDEPDKTEETSAINTEDFRTAGNSVEDTQTDSADCDPPPETMPSSSDRHADLDSGMTHSLSSDDDGSFRSVGSSTTDIFHPTQENATVEEQDLIQTEIAELASSEFNMEQPNDSKPGESSGYSLTMDTVEPGSVSALTVTDCSQPGTEPEAQLSPSLQTMEALNPEGTEEKLAPELPEKDLSLGSALSENGEVPTLKVVQSETGEANDSDPNAEIEHSASEVTNRVLCESSPSATEEGGVIGLAEGEAEPTETDDTSVVASAEESGNVQFALQQHKQDTAEMTADERTPDEGLRHSVDVRSVGAESLLLNNEASSEPHVESEMTENPKTLDAVDGASEGHGRPIQEEDIIMSEDSVIATEEEENGPAEETGFSTIHRDTEASFHQPFNTQHSGSSQSPTLPSRTGRATSCPTSHRDSGSDIESFLGAEPGYDSIFRKSDEPVTGGDSASEVSVSCSSTDDTASVGPSSSSPEGSQGLGCSWSPEECIQAGAPITSDGGGGAGDAEDEAKDRVTEVPRRSCLLRNSLRSLSPLRRHSWGPGKNNGGDAEMNQRSSIRSPGEGKPTLHRRSYSLEGLSGGQEELRRPTTQGPRILEPLRMLRHDSDDRGSLVSLTEEQEEMEEHSRLDNQKSRRYRPLRNSCPPMTLPLTKSVSMLAISQRDIDAVGCMRRKRRISFSFNLSPLTKSKSEFTYGDSSSSDDEDDMSMKSFSSTSGSLAYSISEEEPGPLRSDTEGKNVTKVSRTFSYLKNKMYKKTREKERDKRDKDKEGKEKDKKTVNGHVFTPVSSGQLLQCSHCNKAFNNKEAFQCTHCNASVHKGCRDSLPVCAKVKMKLPKQQLAAPDSSSFSTVTLRNKSGGTRERPWSAILSPEDHSSLIIPSSRRHTSIMAFHGNNLSKSLSISNIAGPVFDEMPIKGLRYLSQSTDSLNRTNQVTESMESLTDEGTEMMDGQLMGEFEAEAKELEADSWSLCVEQHYLQQLDKELVKRQDIIYELMQTEMHHIRTLRIMSEVYSKGLQKEVQLELQTVEKLFPALDELLELHTQHLLRLLERKRESQLERGSFDGSFVISRIGDILVNQFSGSNGESMKRIYGRFCSRHSEAVNFYKDLLNKDKRFKAFIKKKMTCSIVRRLGIPECILLVTQRITKYPVLIQRMLQHTKEGEEDYDDLADAVRLVKEVIAAVDGKVNEHDKRRRLKEFHIRLDSKSIMMMKSGQIFAKEDLLRRRLIHDGALQLKNSQGRQKDVHALLLSDIFVFLQEKDQKYVFAMLDQRSTVLSLQKLIVREVATKSAALFLITAGTDKPEMMEVLARSKDERNTWMQLIQEAMQSKEKDEDEGIPSETEDDKRQLETKAKEMRDMLRQKDTEIMSLLEEKVRLFRGMWEGCNSGEEPRRQLEPFFRSACGLEPPRGASIMKDALQEVEALQALVNGSLGGAMASVQEGGGAGPVCLPRRAETFGGFDSHQMHSSKSGDKDESEDTMGDLRRTESDSVLKKGGNANLLLLLKRNSEQVLNSVSNLHLLLSSLQAVVVQQDSFIEDQRQAMNERSSSCTSLSRPSSRPSSLIEQEKQRSLEKQRQELASLQRQQSAHAEEKKRREKDWEVREQHLAEKEVLVHVQEEEISKRHKELDEEKRELLSKKEEYQRDLERLRDAQRKLERDREAVQRQLDKMEELRLAERTPSTTSDESQFPGSSQSLEVDPLELSSSSSSSLPRLQPQRSKPKGKSLNPFTSSSTNPNLKGSEANNQISKSLLQLAKNKNKESKEKKKKKGKGGSVQTADPSHLPEPPLDGEIFFC
ncbi:LOW QUALITY PROTEIN: A-kinase anchor protein 13 [Scomber scombrus]|uniref:LOW QUALITY PROTEIN: A-kinase anchor protein 13 n=1 Tax=Scomber scombrus TaxID=13677 RepID=UPI002DDAAA55|nr:LOW QUALITY PROTEIN: A-kinase anchor protein 13 [Scomber scombrus]